MCLRILRARIMTVVRRYKSNPGLSRQAQKTGVHLFLLLETMILQLQVEMIFSEDVQVLQRRRLRLLIQAV